MTLKAPFPWFGGKSRVAQEVWDRFGSVDNYVEPFAGSLAVLLGRPFTAGTETVNDIDAYLANFWRATSIDPLAVASHADWPVNEADLHARHLWLVNQNEFRERMKTDPDFFDAKIAGWWVWGISQWIGSGWCSRPEWTGRSNAGGMPRGIHRAALADKPWEVKPSNRRMGIHRQIPNIGNTGKGVHAGVLNLKRPMIHGGHHGKGVHAANPGVDTVFGVAQTSYLPSEEFALGTCRSDSLLAYFEALRVRLRRVRVCCGDWMRVTGPSVTVKHGYTGVFLDPPYDMRVVSDENSGRDGTAPTDKLYNAHDNDISADVRAWAIKNGGNPLLRIALCGYEGEHQMPDDWECVRWKAVGGYGSQRTKGKNENAGRERVWFSPHCLKLPTLFEPVGLL